MVLISYILMWQLSEFLSIVLPTILFLILHYLCHLSTDRMITWLKKHGKWKLLLLSIAFEALAFIVCFPFILYVLQKHTNHAVMFAYSIFLLQLIPWFIKYKSAYDYIHSHHKKNKDHAIYQ